MGLGDSLGREKGAGSGRKRSGRSRSRSNLVDGTSVSLGFFDTAVESKKSKTH